MEQEKRRLVTSLITRELSIFTRSPATHYKDHNGGGASVLIRRGRELKWYYTASQDKLQYSILKSVKSLFSIKVLLFVAVA